MNPPVERSSVDQGSHDAPIASEAGQCHPLGAAIRPGGLNFCVFSQQATAVELLLFDRADDPEPARIVRLDPQRNRTFYYWHVFVPGLKAGQLYGYRVFGPADPARGHRFDNSKVLLDPYSRAVSGCAGYSRRAACRPGDNCPQSLKSVVMDPRGYDWEGDAPLQLPLTETVIYEMHVGGFTRHPNSQVSPGHAGTYAGVVEKIPYLKELGVTAVELLPVQQFDEQDAPPSLTQYWGYAPVSFFAPHRGYTSSAEPLAPIFEFRDMVKHLHRAGIEVILDVVFNHTAEGGQSGPTLCFRGLENRAYYILRPDRAEYADYTGCGNTVKGNHSVTRRMIIDCMHFWVQEMHVDGFRFDLASVLARDTYGQPLTDPPLLWEIESDPVLAGTKIIAEAWDAVGLYQVGTFIGNRWAVWNGQYRDDIRRFVRGDCDTVGKLAARIVGSPDLFPARDRQVQRSINFVTCHDGFTVNDLVSYNHKHNEANNEANRDGSDAEYSWNCGVEGPTSDPAVASLRLRQMKNLLTILFCSQGTPMLLMGDEVRRTQHGNNNAWCQNNEVSWFDWESVRQHSDMLRFVRHLLRFRREHKLFRRLRTWSAGSVETPPLITWHGVQLERPDWSSDSHSIAFSVSDPESGESIYVALNAFWDALTFELPSPTAKRRWRRVIDTALASPDDIAELGTELVVTGVKYSVNLRSAVVLLAR